MTNVDQIVADYEALLAHGEMGALALYAVRGIQGGKHVAEVARIFDERVAGRMTAQEAHRALHKVVPQRSGALLVMLEELINGKQDDTTPET